MLELKDPEGEFVQSELKRINGEIKSLNTAIKKPKNQVTQRSGTLSFPRSRVTCSDLLRFGKSCIPRKNAEFSYC